MGNRYWLTGILGSALVAAPFAFSHRANSTALNVSFGLGLAVVMVSAYKALANDMANWEYWVAGILSLAALIAPFVLRFSEQASATLVLAAILAVLAAYQVFLAKLPEMHEAR